MQLIIQLRFFCVTDEIHINKDRQINRSSLLLFIPSLLLQTDPDFQDFRFLIHPRKDPLVLPVASVLLEVPVLMSAPAWVPVSAQVSAPV